MKRLAVLLLVAGCDPEPSLDDLSPGCLETGRLVIFQKGSDFEPAVRGTLAGWNPDGRWFVTGTRFAGISSFHFKRSGTQVIIDRNPAVPGTIDDTEIFARAELSNGSGNSVVTTTRISNLRPDGTARAERAVCTNGNCIVCTGKLIRATHNADEGEGDHLALLGEFADPGWGPGYTFNVRVADTLAYLIRQDGLHIIETADPSHPVELGHYRRPMLGYSNDVKLVTAGAKRFALLADSPVDVVDVTDPVAPTLAAQIPEETHTVFTETRAGTTLAYFGSYAGTCPVYDVTNPALPVKLGSYDAGASLVHDLSVADGIAYLNAWEAGFHVVDFRTPATPQRLGAWRPTPIHTSHSNWTTTVAGRHIALHGEEGYNAKLDIVDIDPMSPTFMTPIASWQTRSWISIHNLMVLGTKAYFTYYQDGVRVLDISDPVHPAQIGYYNSWEPQADYTTSAFYESAVGLDVDPLRKLVFVADSPRGLLILRDDTP